MDVLKARVLLFFMGCSLGIFAQNRVAVCLVHESASGSWSGTVEYPAIESPFRWSADGSRVTRIEALGLGWNRTIMAEMGRTETPLTLPEGTTSVRFSFEVPPGLGPSENRGWGPGLGAWILPQPRNQRAYPVELSVLCDTPCTVVWPNPVMLIGTEGGQLFHVMKPTDKALVSDLRLHMLRERVAVLASRGPERPKKRPEATDPVTGVAPPAYPPDEEPSIVPPLVEADPSILTRTQGVEESAGILENKALPVSAELFWNSREAFFRIDRAGNQANAERVQALQTYLYQALNLDHRDSGSAGSTPSKPVAHPLWKSLSEGALHPVLQVRQKAQSHRLILEWRCRNCPEGLEVPYVWKQGTELGTDRFVVRDTAGVWTLSATGIPDYARFDLVSGIPIECVEIRSDYSYLFDFQHSNRVIERIQAYAGLIQTNRPDLLRTACFIGLEDPSELIRLMALQGVSEHSELDRSRFRSELETLYRTDPDPLIRELAGDLRAGL